MHIERSLLNEEGTTVGESQSNVEIISIGKPASHRRVEILRLGNTIYFMEKDPEVSFLWPWGLSLLPSMFGICKTVLLSYFCVTNYHKFRGLKQLLVY